MSKKIFIPIVSGFNSKGIKDATKSLGGLKKAIAGVAGSALVLKSVDFAKNAVDQASQLQRNTAGLESVFGSLTDRMTAFTKTSNTMGMSQADAAKATTFLGTVLKSAGFPMEKVAGETERLVALAADLSAVYGYDVSEALTGMTALFRGEYDPIEKFGVAMKQSEINAELAARGQNNLAGAARRNAEQTIRLELLYQRTADAQGQFGEQSGSMFVEQMKLNAAFKDVQATLGTGLLPVMVSLFQSVAPALKDAMPSLLAMFEQFAIVITELTPYLDDVVDIFAKVIGDLASNLSTLLPQFMQLVDFAVNYGAAIVAGYVAMKTAAATFAVMNSLQKTYTFLAGASAAATVIQATATTGATVAQTGLNAALAANPLGAMAVAIGLVVGGLALLVTGIQKMVEANDKSKPKMQEMQNRMKGIKVEGVGATEAMGGFGNMLYNTTIPAIDATNKALGKIKFNDFNVHDQIKADREAAKLLNEDPIVTTPTGETAAQKRAKQIKALADTIKKAFESARARVANAVTGFRESISLSNAVSERGDGTFGFNTGFMFRSMQKLINNSKDFAANIAKLRKGGADNSLLQQLIDMGPGAGATAARQLLEQGNLAELMSLRNQLGGIGRAVGEAGNVAMTGMTSSMLGSANRALQGMVNSNNNTYNINLNKSNMSPAEIIAEIRRYEKTTGRKVLVA
jgi:hypothetical protein